MNQMKTEFGVVGIGVMGKNLALNLIDNDISVSAYDINQDQLVLLKNESPTDQIQTFTNIEDFISSLQVPRKILIMVKAGDLTQQVIDQLSVHLEDNDIIIDGGNQNFNQTNSRIKQLDKKNIRFVGAGISGGAKGARFGPSIMPGGTYSAWSEIKPYLQKIAAKTTDGIPCCQWIGPDGSGHFVKTIHNGIEYSDMELIAESYNILSNYGLNNTELADIYRKWDSGKLNSYLIEITAKIFQKQNETGQYVIDQILDSAGQKGTGKWSVHSSLDLGENAELISSAVFQRFLSAKIELRKAFSSKIKKSQSNSSISNFEEKLENSIYLCKLLSYAQGFSILQTASTQYKWELNLAEIALIWTNGCIIRSKLLNDIQVIFLDSPDLVNLLLSSPMIKEIKNYQEDLREIAKYCIDNQISSPTIFSSLSYLDGLSSERLPANLIQAQRDFFGSHGFKYIDHDDSLHSVEW